MGSDSSAEKDIYTVYQLGEIPYLPHYQNTASYVGPGYMTHNTTIYTSAKLTKAGALSRQELLFTRARLKRN